ncbi:MAG: ABC transporter ATP-binding protein, partial [Agrobacterium vaccinii]
QGHIAQYGATIDLYRNPVDLVSAKTFADPPLNIISLTRSGPSFLHNGQPVFDVPAHLSSIADGPVTMAFHPHHLYPTPTHSGAVKLSAKTLISEIAGSESFIHVDFAGNRWVMLTRGILDIEPDRQIDIYLDTRHLMAFDANGRSLSTPQQAAA